MIKNMKKLTLAGFVLLALATWTHAAVVMSVAISRDTSNVFPTTTAVGAAVDSGSPVDNWNFTPDENAASPGSTFIDSNGDTVNGFTFSLPGSARTTSSTTPEVVIHQNFVYQGVTSAPATANFTLTNTAAIDGAGKAFDLYIYGGVRNANLDRVLNVQVFGDSSTAQSLGINLTEIDTTYTEGDDYLVLSGLTTTTGDISFQVWADSDANNVGIGGFQVVVPEPSTYALLAGMAVMGLVMVRRRFRS